MTDELRSITSKEVLPVLKKQRGFQGEIALVSDTVPDCMLVLSF
jgi:hypothetical protein